MQKQYFAHQDHCFYFSSEVKSILAIDQFRRTINRKAFVELLAAGYPLEGRTLVNEIQSLPPGSILTFQDNKISLEKYWEHSFHEPGNPSHSEDYYIDGYAELFKQSVLKRAKNKSHLLLSGGIDSRSVIGFINRYAPDLSIQTSTLGTPNCQDVRIARKIAKSLGSSNTFIRDNND